MENNDQNQTQETAKGNISRKKYLWVIASFSLLGTVGGYLYYYYIGCNGGCTIQSNPYLSMLWGGAMGYLLPGVVLNPKKD